jgi:hypothetical protein
MHVLPIDEDTSTVGCELATDELQQRRLTGTAWPHDGRHLPARYGHADTAKNFALTTGKVDVFDLYEGYIRHMMFDLPR